MRVDFCLNQEIAFQHNHTATADEDFDNSLIPLPALSFLALKDEACRALEVNQSKPPYFLSGSLLDSVGSSGGPGSILRVVP